MPTQHDITSRLFHIASVLQECEPGCDPDFDNDTQELEQEFAELRMMLRNY